MLRRIVVFAAGFGVSLCAGWLVLPGTFYRTESQPVRFNHQVHTGDKGNMGCADCHSFTATGQFAGVPKLESCANCHTEPLGTTKAEAEFVSRYVKPGVEPRWLIYARQPENAYFSHAVHVKTARLACERCHAGIGRSTTLPLYQVNRISGYSRDVMGRPAGRWGLARAGGMRMDDCVDCHRQRGLSHSCLDCHK
jgi:hypothetical protein